ncbi:unnamed protein product, partial [Mesorhabditis belari]|uniref:BPTI/Kunitz inhibitor domain-containing protein n=1 Tax=Mesorhabditis belari TaxID=2138241 RepID=A0AAF3FQM9_9BILA
MRIIYLSIFLLLSFCGCDNLCSDGHSPLIDGEEAFLCSRQCPDGFQCENVTGFPAEVCCPNLPKLYEIYGDEQKPEAAISETKNASRTVEGKDEQDEQVKHNFVKVKTKDELVLDEESGIQYSCERQNYEILCKNETLATQATIRWFRNGKQCEYYPWGYCPGDLVIHSTTIRTKRACEELCFERKEQKENITTIKPLETIGTTATIQPTTLQFPTIISDSASGKENFGNLTDIIVDSVVEKSFDGNDVAEYEENEEKENPKEIRLRFSKNVQGIESKNDFGEFSVDKVGITIEDKQEKKPPISCQLVPLRTMCDSGMAAQFTWRWILNETTKECTTTPFGYCSGEMNVNLPRTQEECQRACLKG